MICEKANAKTRLALALIDLIIPKHWAVFLEAIKENTRPASGLDTPLQTGYLIHDLSAL